MPSGDRGVVALWEGVSAMRSIKVLGSCAVLVAALVASACTPTTPSTPTATTVKRPSVVLVGDSISTDASAGAQLDAVFGVLFPWNFSRYAVSGTDVRSMRDAIRARAAFRPDVMVIELGTNDMGAINQGHPDLATALTRYAAAVGEMQGAMNDLAGIRCVVWIDINDWSRIFNDEYDLRTWGPVYNDRLRAEAALRPNVHVVDYAAQIMGRGLPWLAANYDANVLIHPVTTEGRQTVAAIMAQGVRNACGI